VFGKAKNILDTSIACNIERINENEDSYIIVDIWGAKGTEDGEFNIPTGIAIDEEDNIYIADKGNRRIQKFNANGNFITKWEYSGVIKEFITPEELSQFPLYSKGMFMDLEGIATDRHGYVYSTDVYTYHNNIQQYDLNGNYISEYWNEFFNGPIALTINSLGEIYVVNVFDYNILKFDSRWRLLTKWGEKGSAEGEFLCPEIGRASCRERV